MFVTDVQFAMVLVLTIVPASVTVKIVPLISIVATVIVKLFTPSTPPSSEPSTVNVSPAR